MISGTVANGYHSIGPATPCIMDKPFQSTINVCHQRMSDWALRLRLMKPLLGRWWADLVKLISLRRKVRLGMITMLASCSSPTKDCRSHLWQDSKWTHFWNMPFSRASFSAGSLSSSLMVSSSTPRNVRQVVGPSRLSDAIGKPSRSHECISNVTMMWRSSERGLSTVIKSLR